MRAFLSQSWRLAAAGRSGGIGRAMVRLFVAAAILRFLVLAGFRGGCRFGLSAWGVPETLGALMVWMVLL